MLQSMLWRVSGPAPREAKPHFGGSLPSWNGEGLHVSGCDSEVGFLTEAVGIRRWDEVVVSEPP